MAGAEYLGADGIRRFFTDIEDIGPDFRIEVQRVQAIGDSTALAFLRTGSTGRASGIVTATDSANVYDFIDGKVRNTLASGEYGGAVGNAALEIFSSANNLKNAMGALVAYTGNPNPATLAHFSTQYQPAVAEWNKGIEAMWHLGDKSGVPSI